MTVPTDSENLARLRVAVITGRLPRDVGQWALAIVNESMPSNSARHLWVRALRDAAMKLPGSLRSRSMLIADCIAEMRVRPGIVAAAWFHHSDFRADVQRALRVHPDIPVSPRHIARLIS